MQILKESPDCYIQHCAYCGAVLKYSECDIHVKKIKFTVKNDKGNNNTYWFSDDDTFVCPCCYNVNIAERKWMY